MILQIHTGIFVTSSTDKCWNSLGELAYHGHQVKIWDVSIPALNAVYNVIEDDKKQLREDGLLFQKNFVVSEAY